MKTSESSTLASSNVGHMKNGVIVLDDQVSLRDELAVRVEPLGPCTEAPIDGQQGARVPHLQQLFAEWTEEDAQLSDQEADRLHSALEQQRGLHFRSPTLD